MEYLRKCLLSIRKSNFLLQEINQRPIEAGDRNRNPIRWKQWRFQKNVICDEDTLLQHLRAPRISRCLPHRKYPG